MLQRSTSRVFFQYYSGFKASVSFPARSNLMYGLTSRCEIGPRVVNHHTRNTRVYRTVGSTRGTPACIGILWKRSAPSVRCMLSIHI
jgi:hypothetical protein